MPNDTTRRPRIPSKSTMSNSRAAALGRGRLLPGGRVIGPPPGGCQTLYENFFTLAAQKVDSHPRERPR